MASPIHFPGHTRAIARYIGQVGKIHTSGSGIVRHERSPHTRKPVDVLAHVSPERRGGSPPGSGDFDENVHAAFDENGGTVEAMLR